MMASRMEKYHDVSQRRVTSRLERNKQKYDDFKNMSYTEFSTTADLDIPTKFIDKDEPLVREKYQLDGQNKRDDSNQKTENNLHFSFLEDVNSSDYDINEVLKKARENREKQDDLEYKRKLRTSDFNILEGLDDEKIEKIKQRKKELVRDGEDSDIEDLINTITSNSLSRKINEKLKEEGKDSSEDLEKDLLSELLPDRIDETIITEAISDDMVMDYKPGTQEEEEEEKLDTSFYTRSMDLSDADLVKEVKEKTDNTNNGEIDTMDTSFVDDGLDKLFFKVLSVILVVVIIAVILFLVYNTCRVK